MMKSKRRKSSQTYDDEHLINYLLKFVCGKPIGCDDIRYIDLYGNKKPCELFDDLLCSEGKTSSDHVNYFFTRLKKKSVHSKNFNRTIVGGGSWKGRDTSKAVLDKDGSVIGSKKTFRFDEESSGVYWIMKEYYLNETIVKVLRQRGEIQHEDFVVCSIMRKVSLGKISQDIQSKDENVVIKESLAEEEFPWPLHPELTELPPLDGPFESLTEEDMAFFDKPDPGHPQQPIFLAIQQVRTKSGFSSTDFWLKCMFLLAFSGASVSKRYRPMAVGIGFAET
ncbi:NAC domain-containing protein 1-like [Lycium ferocissimum]|uniref:NAC domain-containing protein 1-like n=1 Tax=Lycium ferocissimum TaxID=112874 RepID=UPI0028168411|nr:NAC domain-containing protein 1-like [Lycium ferocissimum]